MPQFPFWSLAVIAAVVAIVDAGKILIYSPSISYSHLISNGRIADTLVRAGHDVVMFIPEYMSSTSNFNGTKLAKVIRMNNISKLYEDGLLGGEVGLMKQARLSFTERLEFEYCLTEICRAIMARRNELEPLKNYGFDAAFAEQIDLCGIGVIRYLGIRNLLWISTTPLMDAVSYNLGIALFYFNGLPFLSRLAFPIKLNLRCSPYYIETFLEPSDLFLLRASRYLGIRNLLWISTTPLMDAVSYNLGVPAPPSYVPTIEENDNGDTMNFWQRAFNQYMYFGAIYTHRKEIAANASLCFVNADEMFDFPRPIIHKTIYIGGLGISEPKPLNEKFSALMKKGKKGVIIVSLGTIAPFHAFPDATKKAFVSVFKSLADYHFILKIAKGDNTTHTFMKGVKNCDLIEWLPQSDILAHPRLKLFVMHGGINGMMEALLRAVPVVVIPIFADQFRNGRNAEKRGVGKVILKLELTEQNIKTTIEEVLNNESYKKNAIRIAKLMSEKPFSAEERLVRWTNFAVENGVLDELHVEGSRMNFIVYFNLDVIFVGIITLCLITYVCLFVFLRPFISWCLQPQQTKLKHH
ncbi:unnamed protein product [Haemonchus placei]|uniref:glucuronosyltransferase n=1 Tax=Haemonchus placei TaxID=6290 RepID=A0A0N4X473_HAEPC|nr:unnamed protein product [Haemonchus placei]